MSKERDLLGRWYNGDLLPEEYMKLMKETKELLAQPEEILEYGKVWVVTEVKQAHGIGVDDETK
jgi:hypothetical protein